ncbi:MAG TPA: hypothetical protein VFC78_18100 [Tepidisphaeraceae bacterium]|nr:hypothetical protein [Tepidisphaeraceae bacterium]
MKRASQSIALVLITSASILQGCDRRPTRPGNGNYSTTRPSARQSNSSHSSWYYGSGSRYWGASDSWNSSSAGSTGAPGTASRGASRGGFGSTGHGGGHGGGN